MKRYKILAISLLVFAIIIGIIVYFIPISFNLTNTKTQISIVHNNFASENGDANLDTQTYNNISDTKKAEIFSAFNEYKYQRKWNTLFSNGSMENMGNDVINMYLYDENTHLGGISVSSSGQTSVNGKSYTLKKSEDLINRLLEILATSE